MRKSPFALFVAGSVFLLVSVNALAGTYYIDCAGGSDSQSGTSQAAAWLHHPYMVGFNGHYAHSAGDQFYFKGGVTCPNSYFPLTVANGGSSTTSDYYGPDPTQSWFAGPAWTRTIMSAGGAVISGNNVMFNLGSTQYVTFDNFEVIGMKDSNTDVFQHDVAFLLNGNNQTVEHMYFHAWVVTGSNDDNLVWIHGCNQSCTQSGDLISENYCNGADATPPSTSDGNGSSECIRYLNATIQNNVMLNVSNGIIAGGPGGNVNVLGNDCSSVWISYAPGVHGNCIEMNGSGTTGNVIANNKIHDFDSVGVWPVVLTPSGSQTEWVFNNVCWNVSRDCYDIDTQGNYSGYTVNIENNTGLVASGFYCIATTDRGSSNVIGAANIVNNHCITPSGTSASSFCFNSGNTCSTITHLNVATNIPMSTATATTQGYTSSQTFSYSPSATSNSTVGAGTNLTTSCSGSSSGLCSDTIYSCSVGPGNILVCPARSAQTRASGGSCTLGVPGCWDAGAYLYSSGNAPPNPPGGLQAFVQ